MAYKYWLKRNKPFGSDQYDWFKAEHNFKQSALWLGCSFLCLYLFLSLTLNHHLLQYSWPFVAIAIIAYNWFFELGMAPKTLAMIISIFIALNTLSMQNKSLLKEIEHFELSNRPFISVDSPIIEIRDKNLDNGHLPELKFFVAIDLKNHGKLPAYIENIGCVVRNLSEEASEPFMPYPIDKEKQIKNFDLFPDNKERQFSIQPSINIDAVMRLMLDDIQNAIIRNKDSDFWKKDINEIISELNKYRKPFYLIFQVEYYMINDDKKIKPYFYSVQFRVDQNGVRYFKSNSKKWFDFNNDGIIRWNKEDGLKGGYMQISLEKFSFNIAHLFTYVLTIIGISLFIRFFLTFFKVAAIRQGEADEDGISYKSLGRWEAYWKSFFSLAHTKNIDDYWLPPIVGSIELFSYPILLINNRFDYIGIWIGTKTAVQWLRWSKSRTPFNRYLLGNMLVILFSFYLVKFVAK